MAISEPHYRALKTLVERGEIKRGCSLLEIGEANWYGDIEPPFPHQGLDPFAIAKACYRNFFEPSEIVSIDMNGPTALKLDLNQPIALNQQFDLVYNHGTMEHVANPQNVMRTMHAHCERGGLMVHEAPWTGWLDHGMVSFQPTWFYDHAHANDYDIRYFAIEQADWRLLIEVIDREHMHSLIANHKIPKGAMLYVAMRRTSDAQFKIPMQGVYDNKLSEEGKAAWKEVR
jgi:SAM-dependent methyltransferase